MSTHADLSLLSKALGTLAFVLRDDNVRADRADHAQKLAQLIEEFCQATKEDSLEVLSQCEVNSTFAADSPSSPMPRQGLKGAWTCEHQDGRSVIHFEDRESRGRKKFQAKSFEIKGATMAETRAVAEKIVAAVNDNSYKDAIIQELAACLEMCLESDKLSWDAEHDASIMFARTRPQK